eukprot:3703814-Rhodomonas_salina.1
MARNGGYQVGRDIVSCARVAMSETDRVHGCPRSPSQALTLSHRLLLLLDPSRRYSAWGLRVCRRCLDVSVASNTENRRSTRAARQRKRRGQRDRDRGRMRRSNLAAALLMSVGCERRKKGSGWGRHWSCRQDFAVLTCSLALQRPGAPQALTTNSIRNNAASKVSCSCFPSVSWAAGTD